MEKTNLFTFDQNLKQNQLPDLVYKNLGPYPTFQIKITISVFTLFMIDFLLLIPMLFPAINLFIYLTLPFVALLNIWALVLLVRNSEKTQVKTILFIMFLGFTGSWGFFLLSMKYAFMSGVESPIYFVTMTLIYILVIFLFFYSQLKNYWRLDKQKVKETPRWHYYVLSIAVPLGYVFAQFMFGLGEDIVLIVMMGIFIMFAVFFIYLMTKSLHKYLFVKNNPHLVKMTKNQSMKRREKWSFWVA